MARQKGVPPNAQGPRRTYRCDRRSRRRRHAPFRDFQRRSRPARRLCRPRDLWQVSGASRRRGAQRADERGTAQGDAGEACRRLAACVPGQTADRPGQHRGAPDRGSPADPHGFAARPWRGPACSEQAGRLIAARHLRRRAERSRAGSERTGRHRGASLGAAQASRGVARGTVLSHHHDVRGKPRRRRAQGRGRRSLRSRRRHRHVQDHRLPHGSSEGPPDRSGGHREPSDAARRGRDHADHRGPRGRLVGRADASGRRGHQRHAGEAVRTPGDIGPTCVRHGGRRQHGHASPGVGTVTRGSDGGAVRPRSRRADLCARRRSRRGHEPRRPRLLHAADRRLRRL